MERSAYAATISVHLHSTLTRFARSLKKFCLNLRSSAWISVAGLMLGASILIIQAPDAQAFTVRVSSGVSALNVRNGPGTQFGLNGRPLFPGETVRVVNQSGSWYQLPDGGWFSSAFVTGGGTGGGGVGSGGTPINRTVRATTTVNVRNGPGTGFSLNGRPLSPGETVRVVRESNGWYQLTDGGWFSSQFAQVVSGGGTGGGGTPINRTVRATTTVNVRNGPGTGFSLNGRPLYPGETVRVIRESGGWYQLPDGGWFSSALSTTASGGGAGGGGSFSSATISTNGSNLLVRSSPSGGVIGSLSNGTVVRLSGQRSGGYSQLSSGGWVSNTWLR